MKDLMVLDMLQPRFFDAVIEGVHELCGKEVGDKNSPPRYQNPSLALKLGHALKKGGRDRSQQSDQGIGLQQRAKGTRLS